MKRKNKLILGITSSALALASLGVLALGTVGTGFKAGAGDTTVDVHSLCKKVVNAGGDEYFVPTKSTEEWEDFRTAAGAIPELTLEECIDCHSSLFKFNYCLPLKIKR